jgi:hypothetical protein
LQLLDLDGIRLLEARPGVTPLRPELRTALARHFHHGQQGVRLAALTDASGRLIAAEFNDQTRNFVHRDLATILHGEQFLWRGHAFPHSTRPDLFFRLDRRGRPEPLEPGFSCYREEEVSLAGLHVVLVLGKQDMHFQGHRHGPLEYKLRHLAALGLTSHIVSWQDYYRALRARDNLGFLRRSLNLHTSTVNI